MPPALPTFLPKRSSEESSGNCSSYPLEKEHVSGFFSFPSVSATRLLICYGKRWIDIDGVERGDKNTPLHVIAEHSFIADIDSHRTITELLIHAGAHLDGRNAYGKTPFELAQDDTIRTLLRSKEEMPRLKCLCARLITDNDLRYDQIWPTATTLNQFLHLHQSLKRKLASVDFDEPFLDIFPPLFFGASDDEPPSPMLDDPN